MFVATEWYYVRLQTSGGWSSAYGDPLTLFPALGIAFSGISVPLFLQGSKKYKVSSPNLRAIILLIGGAVLVTVSTGWLLTGEFFTPGAIWWDNYGFPLAWRVQLMRGCPPWCTLPSSEMIFNPLFFVVDCLFYVAMGYTIILVYGQVGRSVSRTTNNGTQVPSGAEGST